MSLDDKITGLFSAATGHHANTRVRDLLNEAGYVSGQAESDTGLTWIDGKPIFRRVVLFDTFAVSLSTAPFDLTALGVDTVVSLRVALIGAGLSPVFSDGLLTINSGTDEIRFTHLAVTFTSGHAIVEYTKL